MQPWIELGPTVLNQATYSLPERVARLLKLEVDDIPWAPSSQEQADRIAAGQLWLRRPTGGGIFFTREDESGTNVVEAVALYPTPDETMAGLSVQAKIVRYPETLNVDNLATWVTPWDDEFDRGVLDHVRMLGLGEGEDSKEDRQFYADRFAEATLEAKRLRNSKIGRGPRQLAIKGKTT